MDLPPLTAPAAKRRSKQGKPPNFNLLQKLEVRPSIAGSLSISLKRISLINKIQTMKAALSILCLILLVGCEKPVESVDYSLLVHRDGSTYMAYETEPFTGDAIELHENGNLKMEHHQI